jgi:hypothetical protein
VCFQHELQEKLKKIDPSNVNGRAILTLRSVEIHLSDQQFVSSDDAFSVVSLFFLILILTGPDSLSCVCRSSY